MSEAGGEASPDPLVGTVLAGRYRIVRRLGEGAMGTVYLGEHLKFGRLDAIKVLRAAMAREDEATERFLRGARNASAINHENVCTVYDFSDTEGGVQFLAMEYVEGETLDDILRREGPMPAARAVPLARQVAAALGAAHDLGIVHRDLKPGNVMVTRGRDGVERVKVVDFDIAKGTAEGEGHEVTRMGFVVGTPEYMSPEQLIGDPLDGRSDLYSLGVVLFRMVTGSLPSRATNTQDLMVERLTADPLQLREVAPEGDFPPRLQAVIDRLLRRKREQRYATAREVSEALGEIRRESATPETRLAPAGARAPSESPPVDPPGPRRLAGLPGLAWAGIGGVAVMAVVVAVLSSGGPGSAAPAEADPPGSQADAGDLVNDPSPGPVVDSTPITDDPPTPPVTADEDSTEEIDPPPVRPDPPAIPLDQVGNVLNRQMDSLVAGSGVRWLAAAEDTARMAWNLPEVDTGTRALAAYVMGSARAELGDTADAVVWLRRAVDLVPSAEGYRSFLTLLEGGG